MEGRQLSLVECLRQKNEGHDVCSSAQRGNRNAKLVSRRENLVFTGIPETGTNDENTDKIINTKMEVTPPLTTTDSIRKLSRSSIIDDLMAQLTSLPWRRRSRSWKRAPTELNNTQDAINRCSAVSRNRETVRTLTAESSLW